MSGEPQKLVGIVVFDGVEVLDFCGPFEVFSVTRVKSPDGRREDLVPFRVVLIAEKKDVVTAVGGLKVVPDCGLEESPRLDILVVPGGIGTRREMHNSKLVAWVKQRAAEVETLASVCTGSLILGSAGLLAGKRATTHWKLLEFLREQFPDVHVVSDEHVVREGNLFTSAGISAGIDMALRVVAHHLGESVARATAKQMEYPYPKDNRRRVEIAS